MIQEKFVRRKIDLITEDLSEIEDFKDMTFDEAAGDPKMWAALEWMLARVIGRAVDINRHILAEIGMDKLDRAPKDYKETFLFLPKVDLLPVDFAEEIAESAGFRNRVVHDYNDIDKSIVYNTIGDAIRDYSKYCDYVLNFLEKYSE